MDAGVLQLHVFEHDSAYEPMRLTDGEGIEPSLTVDDPIIRTGSVSLVVPTYFNRTLKQSALRHLLAGVQSSPCIREIVLVAADGEVKSLEELRSLTGGIPLVIVPCEPNRRAEARNIGVQTATQEIILFLDDDMLLQDWKIIDVVLSKMLEGVFDCSLFPRRTYLRFPLLYQPDRLGEALELWRDPLQSVDPKLLHDPVKVGSPYKTMAFCFPGCFMMITRHAFELIGAFPDGFQGWGFEDTDFAMRAVTQLKVLNLFRKISPLVHIDHPVSPYKSEEYHKNMNQFYSSYNVLDMDWLCRQVFIGENFFGKCFAQDKATEYALTRTREAYLEPMRDVIANHLPISVEQPLRNYAHVLQERLTRGLNPIPELVMLHGSRGAGNADSSSDFDVLFLFRGGSHPEYFTYQHGKSVVEFEYSDFAKFENFAATPAFFAMRGPMELAKIAQARVLFGNDSQFRQWRSSLLSLATRIGFPIWCLYTIDIMQEGSKFSAFLPRYRRAMEAILRCDANLSVLTNPDLASIDFSWTNATQPDSTGDSKSLTLGEYFGFKSEWLHDGCANELIRFTTQLMDRDLSDWRIDMQHSKRVFAHQVPEVWRALRLLQLFQPNEVDG